MNYEEVLTLPLSTASTSVQIRNSSAALATKELFISLHLKIRVSIGDPRKPNLFVFILFDLRLTRACILYSRFSKMGFLGQYGDSQWALANFTLPPECACICAFSTHKSVVGKGWVISITISLEEI